jgi:hypothetical protein
MQLHAEEAVAALWLITREFLSRLENKNAPFVNISDQKLAYFG